MASDPDRRQRIRAAAAELRDAPRPPFDPDDPLSQALVSASIPEIIALVTAAARNDGIDETEHVEVFVRALPNVTRQELLSWDSVMRPLGYARISGLLRSLARHAPSKPAVSVMDRIRARRADTFKKQQN